MRVESVYKCDEHYPVATAIALELTSPMATLSSREKNPLSFVSRQNAATHWGTLTSSQCTHAIFKEVEHA